MGRNSKFSVLILCGGHSHRMGKFKGALQFDEGRSFLKKILETYKAFGIQEIILVVNEKFAEVVREETEKEPGLCSLVINRFPEKGRMYSVQLGISVANETHGLFIQNIDNPFVDPEILERMAECYDEFTYVKPIYNTQSGHPVLIGSHLLKRKQVFSKKNTLRDWLHEFDPILCQVNNPGILININDPDDYRKHFNVVKL